MKKSLIAFAILVVVLVIGVATQPKFDDQGPVSKYEVQRYVESQPTEPPSNLDSGLKNIAIAVLVGLVLSKIMPKDVSQ
jgi:hypothetical protein